MLWNMLPQCPIGFLCHQFAPFVGGTLSGNLYCQMREPAIGGGTMPVLDLRGNIHYISRMQLLRCLEKSERGPNNSSLLQAFMEVFLCSYCQSLVIFAIVCYNNCKEAATHTGRKAHDDL